MTVRRWHQAGNAGRSGRGITVLYVLAAFGGGAALVALRWSGFSAIVTAFVGSAVVVLYALAALPFKPRALSTGPIGDNCYYLGFIFTLTSLAWSLYAVGDGTAGEEGLVLEIVSGFGIALLTTAVGVVMRVALNSPRVDMIEEEQAAFQSIRHYYDLMHRDLAALSTTNKQFALGLRLSLEEFRKAFADDLRAEADARREAIRDVVSNAEKRLLDRLAALETRATRQLESAGARLETTATTGTTAAIDAVRDVAETHISASTRDLERQLLDSAEAGRTATDTLATALAKLSEATDKLALAASRSGHSIEQTEKTISRQLETVSSALDGLDARHAELAQRMSAISDRTEALQDRVRQSEQPRRSIWPRWMGR